MARRTRPVARRRVFRQCATEVKAELIVCSSPPGSLQTPLHVRHRFQEIRDTAELTLGHRHRLHDYVILRAFEHGVAFATGVIAGQSVRAVPDAYAGVRYA